MKDETKYKILRWVEKLLKWNPTDGVYPIIEKKKRDIQLIRHQHIYNQDEWDHMERHNYLEAFIKRAAAQEMAKVLASDEVNAIKIEFEPNDTMSGIKVTSKLEYLLPL